MEQASVRKPSNLPYLICRIGAGTPVVSKTYLFYTAQPDTPSVEADSHETPSTRDAVPASPMPLPSTPYSQAGSTPDLRIEEPMASKQPMDQPSPATPIARPEDAPHGTTSYCGHVMFKAGSEALQVPGRRFEESGDMTPPLPKNPAVTPVAGEPMSKDSDFSSSDSRMFAKQARDDDRVTTGDTRKVADYFSYTTTRVIVLPGTPGLKNPSEAVSGSESPKTERRLVLAPGSRPDSMMVEIDDAPWTFETAMEESGHSHGPDPAYDVRQARSGPNVLLAEMRPVPDLDALIHTQDHQSDGPRDVMEGNLAAHDHPDPAPYSYYPEAATGPGPSVATTSSVDDDEESESECESDAFRPGSPTITLDSTAVEKLRQLEPRPCTDCPPPRVGKGKKFVRKVRNAACRPIVLKVILGRELACPTKEALRMLARGEELPPELVLRPPEWVTVTVPIAVSGETAKPQA